jgi:hypothetical protein
VPRETVFASKAHASYLTCIERRAQKGGIIMGGSRKGTPSNLGGFFAHTLNRTLEVTQDITQIQAIEGERRLLDETTDHKEAKNA